MSQWTYNISFRFYCESNKMFDILFVYNSFGAEYIFMCIIIKSPRNPYQMFDNLFHAQSYHITYYYEYCW